jgi:preprotein translocase subunit SecA
MLGQVRESTTQILARLQVRSEEPVDPLLQEPPAPDFSRLRETNADPALAGDEEPDAEAQPRQRAGAAADPRDPSTWGKVARNASCPCGSGRKYKHCHGRV